MKNEYLRISENQVELLENFELELDPIEYRDYKHYTNCGMSKVKALQVIINKVGGDFSQLSEKLQEVAILQDQLEQIKNTIF